MNVHTSRSFVSAIGLVQDHSPPRTGSNVPGVSGPPGFITSLSQREPRLRVLPPPGPSVRSITGVIAHLRYERRAGNYWENVVGAVLLLCGLAGVVLAFW